MGQYTSNNNSPPSPKDVVGSWTDSFGAHGRSSSVVVNEQSRASSSLSDSSGSPEFRPCQRADTQRHKGHEGEGHKAMMGKAGGPLEEAVVPAPAHKREVRSPRALNPDSDLQATPCKTARGSQSRPPTIRKLVRRQDASAPSAFDHFAGPPFTTASPNPPPICAAASHTAPQNAALARTAAKAQSVQGAESNEGSLSSSSLSSVPSSLTPRRPVRLTRTALKLTGSTAKKGTNNSQPDQGKGRDRVKRRQRSTVSSRTAYDSDSDESVVVALLPSSRGVRSPSVSQQSTNGKPLPKSTRGTRPVSKPRSTFVAVVIPQKTPPSCSRAMSISPTHASPPGPAPPATTCGGSFGEDDEMPDADDALAALVRAGGPEPAAPNLKSIAPNDAEPLAQASSRRALRGGPLASNALANPSGASLAASLVQGRRSVRLGAAQPQGLHRAEEARLPPRGGKARASVLAPSERQNDGARGLASLLKKVKEEQKRGKRRQEEGQGIEDYVLPDEVPEALMAPLDEPSTPRQRANGAGQVEGSGVAGGAQFVSPSRLDSPSKTGLGLSDLAAFTKATAYLPNDSSPADSSNPTLSPSNKSNGEDEGKGKGKRKRGVDATFELVKRDVVKGEEAELAAIKEKEERNCWSWGSHGVTSRGSVKGFRLTDLDEGATAVERDVHEAIADALHDPSVFPPDLLFAIPTVPQSVLGLLFSAAAHPALPHTLTGRATLVLVKALPAALGDVGQGASIDWAGLVKGSLKVLGFRDSSEGKAAEKRDTCDDEEMEAQGAEPEQTVSVGQRIAAVGRIARVAQALVESNDDLKAMVPLASVFVRLLLDPHAVPYRIQVQAALDALVARVAKAACSMRAAGLYRALLSEFWSVGSGRGAVIAVEVVRTVGNGGDAMRGFRRWVAVGLLQASAGASPAKDHKFLQPPRLQDLFDLFSNSSRGDFKPLFTASDGSRDRELGAAATLLGYAYSNLAANWRLAKGDAHKQRMYCSWLESTFLRLGDLDGSIKASTRGDPERNKMKNTILRLHHAIRYQFLQVGGRGDILAHINQGSEGTAEDGANIRRTPGGLLESPPAPSEAGSAWARTSASPAPLVALPSHAACSTARKRPKASVEARSRLASREPSAAPTPAVAVDALGDRRTPCIEEEAGC